ncbi:MAG: tetratricopeptide repeat protein [Rhodocyclales bacterium]|nr:tetratricopeptide repeat protein [Rhodocyclales bacterium]
MKSIKRAALAAAMALAFTAPSLAASGKAKAPRETVKPSQPPQPPLSAEHYRSLVGQAVYQVLLGEIALQRGNHELAVSAYGDLAYRTRDPKVLERTVEVASISRRFDVAYEAARLWVEVEPESITARQTLAAVLIMQNRADELGPQISILLEKDKDNLTDNLLRLNRMLARLQDKAGSYRMLEKVLVPYAGIAEAHYALATAAFHAGDRPGALTEIRKAATLRPDWDAPALFESQLLARDSAAAAIEVLERFVKANPLARDVRLHLARGLIAEKRYGDAKKHFDRLLADNPGSTELMYPVAVLALQQNDVATAEPLLLRIMEGGEPAERMVAAFYLGQVAEDRKDHAGAIAFYKRVGPGEQFVPAQVRVASLLMKEGGGLSMARTHLQDSARRHPPGQVQFAVAEAHLLRDAGRDEEALALFDRIIAEQPNQADVLYDAALLAEKLGRTEVLETNLRRVIELRPDSAHAYNALGYSLAERGVRLEEARQLIAKAVELAPEDPFIMDSMGWVLFRLGDLQGALGQLQKAYAIKPDAEIAAHLGEVLWLLGRRDEARQVWVDAGKRSPDSDVLKAVRKKYAP